MALLKEESYTIEDIYALPDGERAELIDGHIYYMAPPSYKHQKLVMELSAIIRNYIKQHKGTCEVLPASSFVSTRSLFSASHEQHFFLQYKLVLLYHLLIIQYNNNIFSLSSKLPYCYCSHATIPRGVLA